MFRMEVYCYGDSKVSPECAKCCFEGQPFNYDRCKCCVHNTEIPKSWRKEDNWIDIIHKWDYYE